MCAYEGQESGLEIGGKTIITNKEKEPETIPFSFTKAWYSIDGNLSSVWTEDISISLFNQNGKVGDFTLTSTGGTNGTYTWTAVKNTDGTFTFTVTGLPAKDGDTDLTYYVTESKVSGYLDPLYGFKQTQGDNEAITSKTDGTDTDKAFDGEYIINRVEGGPALPSAGGSGTNLIYLIGLILTAFAGGGLMMKKRRKQGERQRRAGLLKY